MGLEIIMSLKKLVVDLADYCDHEGDNEQRPSRTLLVQQQGRRAVPCKYRS